MKNRNAFLEVFRTRQGKICFLIATVSLILSLCTASFVSSEWPYKKYVLFGCGFLMFAGCIVFTQYVGAMQNQIDREEREAKNASRHGKKKK